MFPVNWRHHRISCRSDVDLAGQEAQVATRLRSGSAISSATRKPKPYRWNFDPRSTSWPQGSKENVFEISVMRCGCSGRAVHALQLLATCSFFVMLAII
jgi:hypothetical protein